MLHSASRLRSEVVGTASKFSTGKRTEAILKRWKSIFETSVVNWPRYWYYDGRTAVLCRKGENEGWF